MGRRDQADNICMYFSLLSIIYLPSGSLNDSAYSDYSKDVGKLSIHKIPSLTAITPCGMQTHQVQTGGNYSSYNLSHGWWIDNCRSNVKRFTPHMPHLLWNKGSLPKRIKDWHPKIRFSHWPILTTCGVTIDVPGEACYANRRENDLRK